MYVDLDFQKDAPAANVTEIAGYRVLPVRRLEPGRADR